MSVIEKEEELEAFFHDAGKACDRWRVGTEYEKVGIDRNTGKAIPYSGPRGVEFILRELSERSGWEPEEQDGHIIALARANAQITLEPGGQIESAASPAIASIVLMQNSPSIFANCWKLPSWTWFFWAWVCSP